MLTSVIAGFGLGLSLIIAIGAQNLFVLRQGIRREYALTVAAICAISDAVLIALGVSGLGLILQAVPWLTDFIRWAGALFLAGYAMLAARRALRPSGAALDAGPASGSEPAEIAETAPSAASGPRSVRSGPAVAVAGPRLAPVVLTCLALTWLNPHVYLDTVFLLGSVAATHDDGRWWFAAGACTASVVWFFALAVGARTLSRWLATPRAWRILDGIIAVVMLGLAVSLVLPR